jgi:UDP-2,3-diacylglucosamine pyrophosphatase LpxH
MTIYPGLLDFVKQEILNGTSTKQIYEQASLNFNYSYPIKSFYKYVSRVKKALTEKEISDAGETRESIEEKFINILEKKRSVSGDELCEQLSCSPNEIFDLITQFRKKGYEIVCDDRNIILSTDITSEGEVIESPLEDKEIIFGVASDIHFGSKACQITALNEFAEICRKKGVKYIFSPGDLCAGYNVYPGQQFDLYALSAEEQEESVILNLPKGFEWYVLGGNHDYSFIKRGGGHNCLLAIEAQRPDFHYVGFDDADIPILPGVDLKMWHPAGGAPYSYSYRLQKGIEQVVYNELANISRDFKEKPSVRFVLAGHLHIQVQAMFGSIFGMQCGTFEGQSNYLKRLGLHPQVGGYIVKADISRNGLLRNFNAKFYMWPKQDPEDWRHYKHSIDKPEIFKPIFS